MKDVTEFIPLFSKDSQVQNMWSVSWSQKYISHAYSIKYTWILNINTKDSIQKKRILFVGHRRIKSLWSASLILRKGTVKMSNYLKLNPIHVSRCTVISFVWYACQNYSNQTVSTTTFITIYLMFQCIHPNYICDRNKKNYLCKWIPLSVFALSINNVIYYLALVIFFLLYPTSDFPLTERMLF